MAKVFDILNSIDSLKDHIKRSADLQSRIFKPVRVFASAADAGGELIARKKDSRRTKLSKALQRLQSGTLTDTSLSSTNS